jgi:hypothetical protein
MSQQTDTLVNPVTLTTEESTVVAQAIVDTIELIRYDEQLVEITMEVDKAYQQIMGEAAEEGRIGTLMELNIRNPNYMRTLGLNLGIYNYDELKRHYDETMQPTLEEQLLERQYTMTPLQRQELEVDRELSRQQFEPEVTVEELDLPDIACRLIDFQAMCTLQAKLSQLYPAQFQQILSQLIKMCEGKLSQLETMTGYEALQKHMMQIYVPYFSCFPYSLNMLAMRVDATTMSKLSGKAITLYEMGAYSLQMISPTNGIVLVENQTLEVKVILSGKPLSEAIPTKKSIYATESIDSEDEVPIAVDNLGHPYFWMMLRYAYSMPYYLRKMMAAMSGMPENYKYALYFGIGGLPSRYSTWKMKWRKTPEAKYLKYSADKNVMDLIKKYQAKKGGFYRRYGVYYNKRRV